ncbi:MAG: PD-(D/E)XK nuclease family protein [Bryobacteraceae bacterium]
MAHTLFSGPPASGKSGALVQAFLNAGGRALLLVPTATMAEHLRHQLARAGHAIRPSSILTLSQFVDRLCPQPRPVSPATLALHVDAALDRLRPTEFAAVAAYPGFRRALSDAIAEIGSSGAAVGRLLRGDLPGAYSNAITRIFERVEQTLDISGCALRYRRLALAGNNWVDESEVLLDGFYSLNSSELALLGRLAERSNLTVALPDSPDPSMRESLLARGFAEQRFPVAHRNPDVSLFAAPSAAQEVAEVAHRILDAVAAGHAFRDIAVILRSREPYDSALRAAFARFGIPSRSYFTEPLARHPAIRCILEIASAVSAGCALEDLLPAVRLAPFGLLNPAGDKLAFAIEKEAPARGPDHLAAPELAGIRALAEAALETRSVEEWIALVRALLPPFAVKPGVPHSTAQRWRAQVEAMNALDALGREVAEFVPRRIPLDVFVRLLSEAAEQTPLRVPDDRRDVVHILDVYEARQWELPIVFVCGMLERVFPQYHAPDSLLSEAARQELGLPVSAAQQREERLLFDIASTRATRQVVFSYPRFNEKGEDQIASFFLRGIDPEWIAQRARPLSPPMAPRPALPESPSLAGFLAARHTRFSPSALERFLQCPFQFFGDRTLRLKQRPKLPNDRLDVLLQGSIIHELLARAVDTPPLFRAGLFDDVFEAACVKERVPENYRREAIRLELRRHFERFLDNRDIALDWTTETEKQFEMRLDSIAVGGRIDRLDVGPRKQTLVIDYKYSREAAIKNAAAQTEDGTRLQAGLYMLAAERALGFKPVGMMYCGLREEVTWGGWHALSPADAAAVSAKDVERVRPEDLRDIMDRAEALTLDAVGQILSGRLAPDPADRDKCQWCDYRDICRIETASQTLVQVAGS